MTAPNQTTETIEVQGTSVPHLGFGTWQLEGSDATQGVRDALEIGYRQIDTARAYQNEAEIGEGSRRAASTAARSSSPRSRAARGRQDPPPRRVELPGR